MKNFEATKRASSRSQQILSEKICMDSRTLKWRTKVNHEPPALVQPGRCRRMSNDERNPKWRNSERTEPFSFSSFSKTRLVSPRRDIVADPSLRKGTSQFLVFTCVILKMSHPREALLVRCWSLIRVCSIRISGAPCFSFPSMTQARALSASSSIGRWTDR